MKVHHFIEKYGPINLAGRGARVLALLLIAVSGTTCLDEIDLAQGLPLPEGIVVSGRMLAGDDFHEVEVSLEELFRFEGSNRPSLVVTAQVSLVNSDGQSLPLTYRDRVYEGQVAANDPSFRVEDGMSFSIDIVTVEGINYISDPEVLAPALPLTEAYAELSQLEITDLIGNPTFVPAMDYKITTPLRYPNGDPAYLRWLMTEVYQQTDEDFDEITLEPKVCYISLPFGGLEVKVLGNTGNVDAVEDFSIGKNRTDFAYGEGNYMIIRQESISERAFTYFDQVRQIASRELSIFEAPGGPVLGNVRATDESISNVFGYFYVARPTISRVPVTPAEAGNPVLACPLLAPMPPAVNRCTDCLIAENSTLDRPEWWEL